MAVVRVGGGKVRGVAFGGRSCLSGEKRNGVLKGRTCVDGRPQRAYIAKEDASSPTMSFDSLTELLTIFAVENRHVAVADVSGAYLHVDMDEVVF